MNKAILQLSIAATLFAQTDPAHYVAITLPRGVHSENVFIRYVLDDGFGGWVEPHPGVSLYLIGTAREGHAAARLKALLYAPGCSIQTFDVAIAGQSTQQAPFVCDPAGSLQITGSFPAPAGRDARVDVKYAARWAQPLLGLGDDIVTDIPVASSLYRAETGRFHLTIPHLSADPRATAGEFQFWATDPSSGKAIAQLIPVDRALRSAAGLKIVAAYPAEIKFASCGTPQSGPHDAFGFALRAKNEKRRPLPSLTLNYFDLVKGL